MNGGLIARRYATVLLEFGHDKGKSEEIYSDVALIRSAFAANPQTMDVLSSPLKKVSEKKSFLSTVFGKTVSAPTLEFILFTADKGRVSLLDEILRVYQTLYKKSKGICTAEITTAVGLSAEKQKEFASTLEAKLQAPVETEFKTDASIIGGIIVRVDGKQVDSSVSRQLADIEKALTA